VGYSIFARHANAIAKELAMQRSPILQVVLVVLAHEIVVGGRRLDARGETCREGVGSPLQPLLLVAIGTSSSSESDKSELVYQLGWNIVVDVSGTDPLRCYNSRLRATAAAMKAFLSKSVRRPQDLLQEAPRCVHDVVLSFIIRVGEAAAQWLRKYLHQASKCHENYT